jgi:hypothetical protein
MKKNTRRDLVHEILSHPGAVRGHRSLSDLGRLVKDLLGEMHRQDELKTFEFWDEELYEVVKPQGDYWKRVLDRDGQTKVTRVRFEDKVLGAVTNQSTIG